MDAQPGQLFQQALAAHSPLPIVGTPNAYCALQAAHASVPAIYLSGAGVSNISCGLPDLGFTTLEDVLIDVKRITRVCELPLLVDADTGFGDPKHCIQQLIQAGAAGCHIEDQVEAKRCGHRPGKAVISTKAMCERLQQAIAGKTQNNFVIMARCDALANEGMPAVIDRCKAYLETGADMIFVDAVTSLEEYETLVNALDAPVLANLTEFGKTPTLKRDELAAVGIAMALYPLTAFRAMSKASETVYETLMQSPSQASLLKNMQTREELYDILNYHRYEAAQDNER